MPQKTQHHDERQTVQLCVHGQTIVICYDRSDGKLSVVSNTKLWTWDRLLHLPNRGMGQSMHVWGAHISGNAAVGCISVSRCRSFELYLLMCIAGFTMYSWHTVQGILLANPVYDRVSTRCKAVGLLLGMYELQPARATKCHLGCSSSDVIACTMQSINQCMVQFDGHQGEQSSGNVQCRDQCGPDADNIDV